MSIDEKNRRFCDECGRTIAKAHRVYQGNDFCSTCYPRVFIQAACSECGGSVRHHKLATEPPVCRNCLRIDRVCIRCEKPVPRAAMINAGKAVCASCAPFFRMPRPCVTCGKLSSRLSAMPSFGIHEKICESCRAKVTHKTCSVCRKYRPVAGYRHGAAAYCKACQPGQQVTHRCPTCETTVAGSGRSRCRACLNRAQISRESDLVQTVFAHNWVKELHGNFSRWLYAKQPNSLVNVKILRAHQFFFERIDSHFADRENLTEMSLLEHFGTSEMRRHLLPVRFIVDEMAVTISPELKIENSDHRRIENKLRENKTKPWGLLLSEYESSLTNSGVAVRTRRLYLGVAASFCSFAEVSRTPWEQNTACRFLKTKPGQRANLSKFVGHCRQAYGWDVVMPPRSEMKATPAVHKTVLDLNKLLKQVSIEGVANVSDGVLIRILAKALGYPINVIRRASSSQFVSNHNKATFETDGETIDIPIELMLIAKTYIARLTR